MSKQLLDLATLSTGELAHLEDEVESTLTTIFKVNTQRASLSFERRMSDAVTKAWKKTANTALASSLKQLLKGAGKKITRKRIKAFLARIGIALKDPLTAAQVEILGKRLESIYKIGKKLAAKESKFKFSFKAKDARAIKAINRSQVFWVGDFYNTHLSQRVAAVTEEIVLQRGLSVDEAGRELQKTLKREFGITKGGPTKAAPTARARYAGNPEHYFRQVASTVAHRARTFGKLNAYQEAGITRYRLINPMDSRTGRVCFGAGALVLLADGSQLPIEDIKTGMLVVTAEGNVRPVQMVVTRIANDWYTCRSFGGSFTITPDHEIMTANGWKAVSDLHGTEEKAKVFGNTDQGSRVTEGSDACCNKRCDLKPTWHGKAGTESKLAWGYAAICISDPFSNTATAYNLKIAGDDPSYVVAGVAVHNCQVMHNQEFTVQTGVNHMNKILGATSPKQVKAIDPWLSGEETEAVVGNAKPGSKQATDALANANQILPPFHPLCRTEPIVVFKR